MNSAIYLASRSPRRRELLKQIGVKFDPLLLRLASPRGGPDVGEAQHSGESPADYVERTAREKAALGLKVLSMRSMIFRPVLAADTVVIVDGDVLAKPANPEEAASFMRRLSGRSHEVRTAVALAIQGPVLSATSVSTVSFRVLDDADLPQHNSPAPTSDAKPHGKPVILDKHKNYECPEDQRHDAKNLFRSRLKEEKYYCYCINRTCSDVTEYKPKSFNNASHSLCIKQNPF